MALDGAALQMFNHGISTGALFFLVGVIYERSHTARSEDVRRVEQQAAVLLRAVRGRRLHLVGLARPGRLLERVLCLPRRVRHRARIWAVIGIIGIVLTAAYILWKIVQYTFLGQYDPHKIEHWTNVETGAEEHEPRT